MFDHIVFNFHVLVEDDNAVVVVADNNIVGYDCDYDAVIVTVVDDY